MGCTGNYLKETSTKEQLAWNTSSQTDLQGLALHLKYSVVLILSFCKNPVQGYFSILRVSSNVNAEFMCCLLDRQSPGRAKDYNWSILLQVSRSQIQLCQFLVPWLARRPNVLPITSLWELCNKYISCHTVEKKLDFVSCIVKSFSQFSITKITKMNKLPSNISVILYYKKENNCIIPICFLQNSILFSPKFLQNYWISLLWNRRF